ncbi:hypothetical protein E1176_19000 [Fulvivirga sp. RKSG066]|uniref:hypothetical protein n=1 Tax=Fulvivirga aurantia TaxID=2529383 RepID=UPI0012BC1E1E|nr:hypothetical protein [Fulvivirga aurantia]MTI23125.1 hypothetical protein [Fulvivirga aurantia]
MAETGTITTEQVDKLLAKIQGKNNYYESIAAFLADNFNVAYVIIGKLISGQSKVETEVFYANGSTLDPLVYDLRHTPCENIVHRNACFYPTNIQSLFPKDEELKELNVQSYLGKRVLNSKGEAIGLVALMHTDSIHNPDHIGDILEHLANHLSKDLK